MAKLPEYDYAEEKNDKNQKNLTDDGVGYSIFHWIMFFRAKVKSMTEFAFKVNVSILDKI